MKRIEQSQASDDCLNYACYVFCCSITSVTHKITIIMKLAEDTLVNRSFATEAIMVDQFVELLKNGLSPWGGLQTTTEWDYRTGVADVLVRTSEGQLIAFEAKLFDWRRAAHQAYRNTTYARRAYVVLPSVVAERIRVNEQIFSRYGVGLCSFDADSICVLIEAHEKEPLLPWLYERAQSYFNTITCELSIPQPPDSRCPILQGA